MARAGAFEEECNGQVLGSVRLVNYQHRHVSVSGLLLASASSILFHIPRFRFRGPKKDVYMHDQRWPKIVVRPVEGSRMDACLETACKSPTIDQIVSFLCQGKPERPKSCPQATGGGILPRSSCWTEPIAMNICYKRSALARSTSSMSWEILRISRGTTHNSALAITSINRSSICKSFI
jgi:hypothetical protein